MKRISLVPFPSLLLLFTLTLCLFVSLSGCSSGSNSSQVVKLDASWAEYYSSLKDLKQHTDIAVRGIISSVTPEAKTTHGFIFSTVIVAVDQVLWSRNHSTARSSITFTQTGGIYNNTTYQVTDDPLFHVQDQTILFFKEYSPGKYRVGGGPTGRFSIKNGIIRPIVSNGVRLSDTTDIGSFMAHLQSS